MGEERSTANTRKRLMTLRKIQKTEKADAEIDLREKAIAKDDLVKANEDLEQVQQAAQNKENNPKAAMAK